MISQSQAYAVKRNLQRKREKSPMTAENEKGLCRQSLIKVSFNNKLRKQVKKKQCSRGALWAQEAADKELGVDLRFQGLFGTKRFFPDGVYASALWQLPLFCEEEPLWEQMERRGNSKGPSFPASNKQHTVTSLRALPALGHFLFAVTMATG